MKNCHQKLKELLEEVVLPDIEEELDDTFEKINKNKSSNQFEQHIKELHEMRDEFKEILTEIEDKTLSDEESTEIYEEIMSMIEEDA